MRIRSLRSQCILLRMRQSTISARCISSWFHFKRIPNPVDMAARAPARTKGAPPVPIRAHLAHHSSHQANPQAQGSAATVNVGTPMVMLAPASPAKLKATGVPSSQGRPVPQAYSVETQFGGISRRPTDLPMPQQHCMQAIYRNYEPATALSTSVGPSTSSVELEILQQPTQDKSLEVRMM